MCPASASTAMPSGFRQPVTSVLAPDPSGLIENTCPPLKLRTNNCSVAISVADPRFNVEELLLVVMVPLRPSFLRVLASPAVQQHARHHLGRVCRAQSRAIRNLCMRVRTALVAARCPLPDSGA